MSEGTSTAQHPGVKMYRSVFPVSLHCSKDVRKGIAELQSIKQWLEMVTEAGSANKDIVGFGNSRLMSKGIKAAHGFSSNAILEISPF